MINANELRVGVNTLWQGRETRIINAQELYNAITDKFNSGGIAITEEYLKKLGFTLYTLEIKGGDIDGTKIYLEENTPWIFTPWIIQEDASVVCRDIKFVHELQNLYFALTGEELTIKEP